MRSVKEPDNSNAIYLFGNDFTQSRCQRLGQGTGKKFKTSQRMSHENLHAFQTKNWLRQNSSTMFCSRRKEGD
jgi:hypothetical protein